MKTKFKFEIGDTVEYRKSSVKLYTGIIRNKGSIYNNARYLIERDGMCLWRLEDDIEGVVNKLKENKIMSNILDEINEKLSVLDKIQAENIHVLNQISEIKDYIKSIINSSQEESMSIEKACNLINISRYAFCKTYLNHLKNVSKGKRPLYLRSDILAVFANEKSYKKYERITHPV